MRFRRKRRTKFKSITFKLSSRQMRSLKNYCQAYHTTPIKVIKRAIYPYIELYADNPPEKVPIANQLELFEDSL